MTIYEFVTELERGVDYAMSHGQAEHEPCVTFAAARPFWGDFPIRPKRLSPGPDGLRRWSFTLNQARRLSDTLRGREW
jgi:hypothetical protein